MPLLNDLKSKRQGYAPVAVIPSDSDEDDNFSLSVRSNDTCPCRVPDRKNNEAIKDEGIDIAVHNPQTDANLNISIEKLKQKKNQTTSICLLITSLVIFAIIIGFLIQYQVLNNNKADGESPVNQMSDVVWETLPLPYASESVVRLQDLNDDGVLDILHTLVRSSSPKENFCKSIHMDEPCLGAVHAVDGKNGSLLWETSCRSDIFAMNCGNLDIDGDGHNDCLLAGRAAQLYAINSRTGRVLWSADNNQYTQYPWNFYQPQVVPDLDQDGVSEVVVAHGGNVNYPDEKLDRDAGRVILLSGKTGLALGRYLNMSDGHETYSAITLYERPNGALYILYGSGGETIQGSLWGISLRDLYCYVKETAPEKVKDQVPFLGSDSYKESWGRPLQTSDVGVIEILRSDGERGIMVPTILADMNNDGINDLIVSLFNGSFAVLNGDNLTVIWSTGFHGYQSYRLVNGTS
ncbi:protein FAM234B-like isoform X2 [Anneissia japonica]|uniref:protein FAM234B-like isoform X2 n=1 Tax=Anneissia japonica TaxID=1529436 RepID=UPI001425B114|nr:protein FAM234B-like isoform X2 [Anneissia japonica]